MRRFFLVFITVIIILAILAAGGWWFWKWQTSKAEPLPQTVTTDYHLYTVDDAGREIKNINQNSVVVIQLDDQKYGDPISITDIDGHDIAFTRETINDNIAISVLVKTTATINIRVHALQALQQDFTLSIIPNP